MRWLCISRYVYVSWGEAVGMSYRLAGVVVGSGYVPDVLVAVSRGGLVPARIVSDVVGVDDVYSIKASLWGVGGKVFDDVLLHRVELPVGGRKVLVVDDVVDSGSTLTKVVEYVKLFKPADVRTAVIHVKPTSKYLPDYYVSKLDVWVWVIYPWTLHEVIYSTLYKQYGCRLISFDAESIINEFKKLTELTVSEVTPESLNAAKQRYLSKLCSN
ncbi:MAG: phosphoribosyltransferase family protein [Sulfolobales archaeon]